MRIYVTEDDVKQGAIAAAKYCPVALAVKRQLGIDELVVDGLFIRMPDKKYILPYDVRMKILEYDQNGQMSPFDFELS